MKTRTILFFAALFACNATDAAPALPCHTPLRYDSISSVVMQYRWFKFPALGAMSVDARKGDFALVGISQIGINVFELSEKNGIVKSRIPGKLIERCPQIAASAAVDVRHMFFDLSPPPAAVAAGEASGNLAVFKQATPAGTLEYRVDQATNRLVGKRFSVPRKYFFGSTVVWVVHYGNYATAGGMAYPRFVHFKNRKLHYAIATIVKEMRIK